MIESNAVDGEFKRIILSEGIEQMEDACIYGGDTLEEISLPSSLKMMVGAPIVGGINISSIVFPNGSERFRIDNENKMLIDIKEKTLKFVFGGKRDEVTVPDGIKYIESDGLENVSPKIVNLPKSLREVFQMPNSLEEMHFKNANCRIEYFGIPWTDYDSETDRHIYTVKVYAPAGGTIEEYCNENGITFEAEGEYDPTVKEPMAAAVAFKTGEEGKQIAESSFDTTDGAYQEYTFTAADTGVHALDVEFSNITGEVPPVDAYVAVLKDNNGNEINAIVDDPINDYCAPGYLYYLTKGMNYTLRFEATEDAIADEFVSDDVLLCLSSASAITVNGDGWNDCVNTWDATERSAILKFTAPKSGTYTVTRRSTSDYDEGDLEMFLISVGGQGNASVLSNSRQTFTAELTQGKEYFLAIIVRDQGDASAAIKVTNEDYDPGDEPAGEITTVLHPESGGGVRTIVMDEMSDEMNFPENGDGIIVGNKVYAYDSVSDCFKFGNETITWDLWGTDSYHDEETDTYTFYVIIEYYKEGNTIGKSWIETEYGNEIVGMEFIPNGKTELDASAIQTGDGYDISKRGNGSFFIEGDKIKLTNKFNGNIRVYEFTFDPNSGGTDFKCEGYGSAPTYAYCDNPGLGDNIVRIDMLDGTTTTTIKIIGEHEHSLVPVAGKEANCKEEGYEAYYQCSVCKKLFSDADGETEISAPVVIPKKPHTLTYVEGKGATCTEDGNEAYYKCSVCEKYFSDGEGKNEIAENSWVIPASHDMAAHEAIAATCTDPGNSAYWYCSKCEKYFSDADGKTEIVENSWVVEALGHDWDEGQITTRAEANVEGVMTYTCKRDQKHTKTEKIAALGDDHTPVNQAAENAIAAVDEAGSDADAEAASAAAQTAADNAVDDAKEALDAAKATGDEAKINAAKQDLKDAEATQAKATAVAAKVSAKKSAASASAKQAAAAAQATAGTDAAVAAAQASVDAANAAKADADAAVTAAEAAVEAAEATGDTTAVSAARDALSAAKTAQSSAANAVTAANGTLGTAVAARNAAKAAQTPPAPTEITDLPTVKISKPKAAKKKITVKWKKVSKKNLKKISGIQIQVATDPNFTNIVKATTASKKKTSKVIKGLQPKTKYYVRIRAYAAGDHYSLWKSKSVKVK